MNIGVQLRVYRKSKGHSVQKVSELTGINADKLYKWEKGTRPSDAEDLLKIREYLAGKVVSIPKNGLAKSESKSNALVSEGPADIAVLDRLMKQLESRADELKADKERLYTIIENYLNSILSNTQANQEQLKILRTQADIVIKQIAHQDEAILRSQLQKSDLVKGGKVKSEK